MSWSLRIYGASPARMFLWPGPPCFNCWFSFTLAYSRIGHECSSLFIIVWFLCFHFDALTELGAFMRTEFLCISVLRVASGPRVKLASCKSALTPPPPRPTHTHTHTPVVYSTDCSKAVVPVLILLIVALWFVLRGDLFYVLPCVISFLFFSVLLALRLPRLGKREKILVLFVCLFHLRLFGFVCFLFLFVSGKACGLCWEPLCEPNFMHFCIKSSIVTQGEVS